MFDVDSSPTMTVATGLPEMSDVTPAMRRKVKKAAADLAAARSRWQIATAAAALVANMAHEAGMSEVELARELGVDRARTLRRWLGKPVSGA